MGKAGRHDPDATYVTRDTAPLLLQGRAAPVWRVALELATIAASAFGSQAIPEEDWGRIKHFIRFWRRVDNKPEWLETVVEKLSHLPSAGASPAERPRSRSRQSRAVATPLLAIEDRPPFPLK